jgi:hypothetical protein
MWDFWQIPLAGVIDSSVCGTQRFCGASRTALCLPLSRAEPSRWRGLGPDKRLSQRGKWTVKEN